MPFPKSKSIEMPVIQELSALGGEDDVRFMYERLTAYFPQLSPQEIIQIQSNQLPAWRKIIQRAGRDLDQKGYIERRRGIWNLTAKGRAKVASEAIGFDLKSIVEVKLSHIEIQKMIVQIGEILGFYTEMEFEYYDVVWREVPQASRLSHVFEVQSKGNIDSAFAKLKRAYEAQRSKIFLVIASERDLKRAKKSLTMEFQDIETDLTILTFAQIQKAHQNIDSIKEVLIKLLES